MSLDIFSALNVGVGLGTFIVGVLALIHFYAGWRLDDEQEHAAMRRLGWGLACLGFSYAFSGVMGTLINLPNLEGSVPLLALVPLVVRIAGGFFLWELIRYVIFVYYPAILRRK